MVPLFLKTESVSLPSATYGLYMLTIFFSSGKTLIGWCGMKKRAPTRSSKTLIIVSLNALAYTVMSSLSLSNVCAFFGAKG